MVVNDRPFKRLKRVVMSTDLYDFLSFPTEIDNGTTVRAPFRCSVQSFLKNHARQTFPQTLFPSLMMWQILFSVSGPNLFNLTVALDIVKEDVTRSRSSVYCNQCRVVGWSGHPVCLKRYHFIIRADSSDAIGPYQTRCSRCSNLVNLSEPRCKCCNLDITADDIENWVYLQIEDNTHLLHGVVHSNGYGHLLTINGREGGSKILSGSDIMGFWDRLCASLAVRKVSVMDLSKKFGLEFRLLHAITNGCSWYGNWGYEFGTGSYGLTQDAYQKAVNTLSCIPLSSFLFGGRGPRNRLQCVIALYQSLADTELLTIKDLFSFLLKLIHEQHGYTSTSNVLCAWTSNDVVDMQHALIKVLFASGAYIENRWVSRRALKGAVCGRVASPELVDYSLKHLGGRLTTNGMVVISRCNPNSSAVEFRLEPFSVVQHRFVPMSSYPSEEQVVSDLRFLFDSIVHPDKMESNNGHHIMKKLVADSARKLLDCKQFMKDYKPERMAVEPPSAIRLWCHVELLDEPKDDPSPPPELIVLPLTATVADLKREVTSVFQEVYPMYKRFQAVKLLGYGSITDSFTIKLLLGTSGSVRVLGKCTSKHGLSRFRMERGMETWEVDCQCGAKDDDGERMLACDACGVWQHTRCAGIDNNDDIPSEFMCVRCINSYDEGNNKACESNPNTTCNVGVVAADNPAVAYNMTANFGVD